METEIRQLVCRALLTECFRLVLHDFRARVQALSSEISHREKVIRDHHAQMVAIYKRLVKIRDGKLEFDNGKESEKLVSDQIDQLAIITRILMTRLIQPLEEIMKVAPADDEDGCEADQLLLNIRVSQPWKDPLEIANKAHRILLPARRVSLDRLRELQEPRRIIETPARVFIASTSEGLEMARRIAEGLNQSLGPRVSAVAWRDSPYFAQNVSFLRSLEQAVDGNTFGVAFFSNDDSFENQRPDGSVPMGNVILEHGMFTGRHSRFRAFLVHPAEGIPGLSDLKGLNTAKYGSSESDGTIVEQVVGTLSKAISSEIESHKPEAENR